ncbi:MAG: hypothetical protein NC037_01010 [Bacteroides sp.]|nr:hypothetical protein [Bacillota bacterium]MCM1393502.1 hypothetical protein [[Eubacterium] siraeum]MCM1455095.1 hypothetical protein [Bacteroides sp.]
MLILIIFGVLTVIGIVVAVLGRVFECYLDYNAETVMKLGGSIVSFLFGMALIIAIGFAMGVQIPKEKDYQAVLYEKEVLEYRLEHIEENLVGNEILYSEIIEFNNQLRDCKYYSGNLWLNLFYNDKIATIDYIGISGFSEGV